MTAWNITRVRAELGFALGSVYGIRMSTPHSKWTEEQVELLTRVEADLVKLRASLKEGWKR